MLAYEDIPESNMNTMDRLNSLRAAQRAWKDPQCAVTRRNLELPWFDSSGPSVITSNQGVIIIITYLPEDIERSRLHFIIVNDILHNSYGAETQLAIENGRVCIDASVNLAQRFLITIQIE